MLTFGLLQKCLPGNAPAANAKKPDSDDDDFVMGDNYHRVASKRQARLYDFASGTDNHCKLLLWMAVAGPLMSVHYHLFGHGRFASHDAGGQRSGIWKFCTGSAEINPAARAFRQLSSVIQH